MRETDKRKTLLGTVVSDKRDKTITVRVNTHKSHHLYGKRFLYSKKFSVHDPKNEAKEGDRVLIMSTRPYSKTKSFRLVEIKERKAEE